MSGTRPTPPRGRSTSLNPPNRFERLHFEPVEDEPDDRGVPTVFYIDSSKSVLSKNDSPDVPFTYSVNPYRGCEHGCVYCYARPSHEYLGFSAGLDFETKILVKSDVAALLRRELAKPSWTPQMVALSGNTDCYQPAEKSLRLSRACLEVFLECRNPVGVITKNGLVARDIDLLAELASMELVTVMVSMTTMDADLTRRMEPRTASPALRVATIGRLASAGIPVGVNVAPVIPGLNDHEIPDILKAAADAGARFAGSIMLRLPGPVQGLFIEWLERTEPGRAGKVINRIKDVRGGALSDPRYKSRMRGEGEMASAIHRLFEVQCGKLGLNRERFKFNTAAFRRPEPVKSGRPVRKDQSLQMELFDHP